MTGNSVDTMAREMNSECVAIDSGVTTSWVINPEVSGRPSTPVTGVASVRILRGSRLRCANFSEMQEVEAPESTKA